MVERRTQLGRGELRRKRAQWFVQTNGVEAFWTRRAHPGDCLPGGWDLVPVPDPAWNRADIAAVCTFVHCRGAGARLRYVQWTLRLWARPAR
jgi:hypothetical protein